MNKTNQKELELIKILISTFKSEIKKQLDPLFLEKFSETFNSDELNSLHIELISLCLLKKFIENPYNVFEMLDDDVSFYLENGSKMQVLFYLEELIKYNSLKEVNLND